MGDKNDDVIKNIFLYNIQIEGDIIELGVYKGRNTFIAGDILKSLNQNKKYIGYDTFNGYTKKDIDSALTKKQRNNLIKNNNCKIWNVNENDILKKIEDNNLKKYCQIIKGDICETIKFCKSENIQTVYVDCNAYLPSITALRELKNKLQDSSFIIIDEHIIGGETAALRDFMKEIKGTLYKIPENLKGPRIIFHVNLEEKRNKYYYEIEQKLKSNFKIIEELEKE